MNILLLLSETNVFCPQGLSKRKCAEMVSKQKIENLLPDKLLAATNLEIEADLADLKNGVEELEVDGKVDDVFQELKVSEWTNHQN